MKIEKLVLAMLIFAFAFGLECSAQKLPIRPYLKGDSVYSLESMRLYYKENTPVSNQCVKYFLLKTGEKDLNSLFKKVITIDTTLKAGTYQNSYWDVPTGTLKFCSGKEFTGKISVYKEGKNTKLLFKNKCGNALDELVDGLSDEDLPYGEDKNSLKKDDSSAKKQKGKVYYVDTKNQKVHVVDTVYVSSETNNNFYYYGDGTNYTYYPRARYQVFYDSWLNWDWYYYSRPYVYYQRYPIYRHYDYGYRMYSCNDNRHSWGRQIDCHREKPEPKGKPAYVPGHGDNGGPVTALGHGDVGSPSRTPGHGDNGGLPTNVPGNGNNRPVTAPGSEVGTKSASLRGGNRQSTSSTQSNFTKGNNYRRGQYALRTQPSRNNNQSSVRPGNYQRQTQSNRAVSTQRTNPQRSNMQTYQRAQTQRSNIQSSNGRGGRR